MVYKSRVNKIKNIKNKTSRVRKNKVDKIWGNYGMVLNIKTNRYVRIGSYESLKAISQLKRDAEWKRRVDYITRHSKFGEKLQKYLEKH